MPFGSEEAWWLHPQGYGSGNDRTLDLLQNQKQMDVDQSRRRGDADLAHKREMGDIYGEMPTKALNAYWSGTEEARKGEDHDLRQREGEQRMDFNANQDERLGAEEGRRGETYDYNKGQRHWNEERNQRQSSADQAEEAYRNELDPQTGRTKFQVSQDLGMDTQRQGLENQKLSGKLTSAQLGEAGTRQTWAQEDRQLGQFGEFADAAVAGAAQRADMVIAKGGSQEEAQAAGAAYIKDTLMADPAFAKLPENRKNLIVQNKASQLGSRKGQQNEIQDMAFASSPAGARYNAAMSKLTEASSSADRALKAASSFDQATSMGGVGYTRDFGEKAKEQTAQQFEREGDYATAQKIRDTSDMNTAGVIREAASQKLLQAADQLEQATVGLPPGRVQQGLQQATALRQKASQIQGEGPKELDILQPVAPQPAKPQGVQASGVPAPKNDDPLGIFSNSKAKSKAAGMP